VLFALALQFAATFGHVHANQFTDAAAAIAESGSNAAQPQSPAPDKHNNKGDYCALCAVLALLSGAQISAAPVVVAPLALALDHVSLSPEAILSEAQDGAFQARAPPQSLTSPAHPLRRPSAAVDLISQAFGHRHGTPYRSPCSRGGFDLA
jgi:hypothetical protein